MTSVIKQIKAPVKVVSGVSLIVFLTSMMATNQIKGWTKASTIGLIAGGAVLSLWGLEQMQYGQEGRP